MNDFASLLARGKEIVTDFQDSFMERADEARELIVNCAETYLQNINSEKALRPYLIQYPFPAERIEFVVLIPSEKRNKTDSLAVIGLSKGIVKYESNQKGRLETIYKEPYSQARVTVLNKNSKLTLDSNN